MNIVISPLILFVIGITYTVIQKNQIFGYIKIDHSKKFNVV